MQTPLALIGKEHGLEEAPHLYAEQAAQKHRDSIANTTVLQLHLSSSENPNPDRLTSSVITIPYFAMHTRL